MDEFVNAFHDADSLVILDIYAASEPPIEGVTGRAFSPPHPGAQQDPLYAASFAEAAERSPPERKTVT